MKGEKQKYYSHNNSAVESVRKNNIKSYSLY